MLNKDFHPEEPQPPRDFLFSSYTESLRMLLNVFAKKKIKEPLHQNHKKIISHVYKNDNRSYDEQFEEQYWMGEEPDNINFNEILNCEYIELVRAPHVSYNYTKRINDHKVDLVSLNTALEKTLSYYIPLDTSQAGKYEGSLPPLMAFY
jgi:hypothetical protein